MKITSVDFFRVDMELAVPYTIAYETVTSTSNIILRLTTNTGLTGWGCSAPDRIVTNETAEEVLRLVRQYVEPFLHGCQPFRIARTVGELQQHLHGKSSTMAMVDMALHDLLARKADLPLYLILGGFREKIATSVTIGILPLEETIAQAEKYLADGFFILKLKGGLSVGEDVEKIHKLRERFGFDFHLRFDANQGFNVEQAVAFIKEVEREKLEIIEQPTRRDKDESLGRVTESVPIPVMADESISTLGDAFRLAANERIDMINIKLMKMGGIVESLHINSVAKAAGMEVMVGCLDECALGISAGLHFALSRANIEFADLDGHLDLMNDPFTNLFTLQNGWLMPTSDAGLGRVVL